MAGARFYSAWISFCTDIFSEHSTVAQGAWLWIRDRNMAILNCHYFRLTDRYLQAGDLAMIWEIRIGSLNVWCIDLCYLASVLALPETLRLMQRENMNAHWVYVVQPKEPMTGRSKVPDPRQTPSENLY